MSAEHYQNIWQRDEMEDQSDDGVESPEAVLQRGFQVIEKLEQRYQNQVVLVVSHGDLLQILSTAFAGKSPKKHRSLTHHQTAEIKHMLCRNN
jgi:broad specificity phosphatase PhoE